MTKKKTPQTIEECNAELERTQKKIRQYENRSKMLDRRLAIEKRKERNHRLCSRGGFIESIVPELITMTDEDAQTFFRLALTSEPARGFLRNTSRGNDKLNNPLATRAHLYTLAGVVRSAEG